MKFTALFFNLVLLLGGFAISPMMAQSHLGNNILYSEPMIYNPWNLTSVNLTSPAIRFRLIQDLKKNHSDLFEDNSNQVLSNVKIVSNFFSRLPKKETKIFDKFVKGRSTYIKIEVAPDITKDDESLPPRSITSFVLEEIPPLEAVFRIRQLRADEGHAGGQDHFSSAFVPLERVFLVRDLHNNIIGYCQGSMIQAEEQGRFQNTFYLHTVFGPTLSADLILQIYTAFFQANKEMGVSRLAISKDAATEKSNGLRSPDETILLELQEYAPTAKTQYKDSQFRQDASPNVRPVSEVRLLKAGTAVGGLQITTSSKISTPSSDLPTIDLSTALCIYLNCRATGIFEKFATDDFQTLSKFRHRTTSLLKEYGAESFEDFADNFTELVDHEIKKNIGWYQDRRIRPVRNLDPFLQTKVVDYAFRLIEPGVNISSETKFREGKSFFETFAPVLKRDARMQNLFYQWIQKPESIGLAIEAIKLGIEPPDFETRIVEVIKKQNTDESRIQLVATLVGRPAFREVLQDIPQIQDDVVRWITDEVRDNIDFDPEFLHQMAQGLRLNNARAQKLGRYIATKLRENPDTEEDEEEERDNIIKNELKIVADIPEALSNEAIVDGIFEYLKRLPPDSVELFIFDLLKRFKVSLSDNQRSQIRADLLDGKFSSQASVHLVPLVEPEFKNKNKKWLEPYLDLILKEDPNRVVVGYAVAAHYDKSPWSAAHANKLLQVRTSTSDEPIINAFMKSQKWDPPSRYRNIDMATRIRMGLEGAARAINDESGEDIEMGIFALEDLIRILSRASIKKDLKGQSISEDAWDKVIHLFKTENTELYSYAGELLMKLRQSKILTPSEQQKLVEMLESVVRYMRDRAEGFRLKSSSVSNPFLAPLELVEGLRHLFTIKTLNKRAVSSCKDALKKLSRPPE